MEIDPRCSLLNLMQVAVQWETSQQSRSVSAPSILDEASRPKNGLLILAYISNCVGPAPISAIFRFFCSDPFLACHQLTILGRTLSLHISRRKFSGEATCSLGTNLCPIKEQSDELACQSLKYVKLLFTHTLCTKTSIIAESAWRLKSHANRNLNARVYGALSLSLGDCSK